MPKHNHSGNKTNRAARTGKKEPKYARHFIIVTDAKETEINYINGLKKSLTGFGTSIKIKQENTQTNLVKECLKLANTDFSSEPSLWILFDYDNLEEFDRIVKDAENHHIQAAWSNPCIEIWFWAYFEKIPQSVTSSHECFSEFKNVFYKYTHVPYLKNDKAIYQRLLEHGDETQAIQRAETLMKTNEQNDLHTPSKMIPASTVYKLLKEIKDGVSTKEE